MARIWTIPLLLLSAVATIPASGSLAQGAVPSEVAAPTRAGPGMPDEPLSGQPPAGSSPSIRDFDYQIKYQRAFEAMLWSLPATAIYSFRRAFDSLGLKDNDIVAYSAGATPKLEAVTANSTTP